MSVAISARDDSIQTRLRTFKLDFIPRLNMAAVDAEADAKDAKEMSPKELGLKLPKEVDAMEVAPKEVDAKESAPKDLDAKEVDAKIGPKNAVCIDTRRMSMMFGEVDEKGNISNPFVRSSGPKNEFQQLVLFNGNKEARWAFNYDTKQKKEWQRQMDDSYKVHTKRLRDERIEMTSLEEVETYEKDQELGQLLVQQKDIEKKIEAKRAKRDMEESASSFRMLSIEIDEPTK